jgi:hypothetical protein
MSEQSLPIFGALGFGHGNKRWSTKAQKIVQLSKPDRVAVRSSTNWRPSGTSPTLDAAAAGPPDLLRMAATNRLPDNYYRRFATIFVTAKKVVVSVFVRA